MRILAQSRSARLDWGQFADPERYLLPVYGQNQAEPRSGFGLNAGLSELPVPAATRVALDDLQQH